MTKPDLIRQAIAAGGDTGLEMCKVLQQMVDAMEPEYRAYFWSGFFSSVAGLAARTSGKPAVIDALETAKRAVKKAAASGTVH